MADLDPSLYREERGPQESPLGSCLARRFRRISETATLLTPFIAILALWTSMNQLHEVRRSARVRPISEVISHSTQITMWLANYPEIAGYFQSDLFGTRRSPAEDLRLLEELRRAEPATRRRVQTACEVLADFFETTYGDRDSFSPDDWSSWWSYMRDVYDESPVLRAFFERRDRWYTVDDAFRANLARGPTTMARQR